jgi:hypothetical protein
MSDGQTLFAVLSLIYLVECFLWVRKQSVAFLSPWCRRVSIASASFGNANGGFLIMNPLPPLGSVFLSHLSPVSVSPLGVCAFNLQALPSVGRPTQSGRSLAFTEIAGSSIDGAYLLVNNERFVKCTTTAQARAISDLINETVRVSLSERESILRAYTARQFAGDEAAKVLREAASVIRPIRWMCSILFLFLFVATPILVSTLGLLRLFFPVALVMLVFAVQVSVMFHGARKALFPGETRLDQVITMILCPPVAIRAADLLTRDLLSLYSPVVLASLLAGSGAQQFVRAFVLDLQHPCKHEVTNEMSAEIIGWAAADQLDLCLEHIKHSSNLQQEVLLAPPQPSGTSVSYCPRCECQFNVSSGACPDCPGLRLVAFSKHPATVNRPSL